MEEKRNITISLKEAREWYKSNNKALREIALKAYSENELAGYEYMKGQISLIKIACELPYSERGKWYTLHKLAIMAKYYNGDWKMEAGRIGYFIGKVTSHGPIVTKLGDNLAILRHETAQYAGVVYFQKAQDAKDAADLLGDELKLLF